MVLGVRVCEADDPATFSCLWDTTARSDIALLQKHVVGGDARRYRVVSAHQPVELAHADTEAEIQRDWERVHSVAAEQVPRVAAAPRWALLVQQTGTLQPADTSLILISLLSSQTQPHQTTPPPQPQQPQSPLEQSQESPQLASPDEKEKKKHRFRRSPKSPRAPSKLLAQEQLLQLQQPQLPALQKLVQTVVNAQPQSPQTTAKVVPQQEALGTQLKCNTGNVLKPQMRLSVVIKSTTELLDEVTKLEETKQNVITALQPLVTDSSAALDRVYVEYIRKLNTFVASGGLHVDASVVESIRSSILRDQVAMLSQVKARMFGAQSPCFLAIDEKIKQRQDAFEMKRKVVVVQKLVRGWIARKRYAELKKRTDYRTKVAQELLSTERSYMEALEILTTEFREPMRVIAASKKPFVTGDDVCVLFNNIEGIHAVHKDLLGNLEKRLSKWNCNCTILSDIYQGLATHSAKYTQYVNGYDATIATLTRLSASPEFSAWLTEMHSRKEMHGLFFNAFLIMPVQRIPRYSLLLKELVKYTDSDHPDFANLNKAVEVIRGTASEINESKRKAEAQQKVVQIQSLLGEQVPNLVKPHRYFYREGVVLREQSYNLQACFLILLSGA
eukprot:TRINITY_DN4371_c0_g1_i2.p1 TRINITY_DN4371_c0_g1~~TRINITY_DN4371_c0_g1_i2.p1  ORF type:complete len:616 (-),score=169.15 TRINITY_DN4371_c0_g1_i2:1106-2953(-)